MGKAKKSTGTNEKDNNGKKAVLEELRRNFDKSYTSVDIIDGKLQNALGISSLIVSLLGFVNLTKFQNNYDCWFLVWFIAIVLIYLSILIITFRGLRPRDYKNPISSDWSELDNRYFDKDEDVVLDRLNSDYLTFIEKVNIIAKEKANALNTVLIFLSIIVAIILISIPLTF